MVRPCALLKHQQAMKLAHSTVQPSCPALSRCVYCICDDTALCAQVTLLPGAEQAVDFGQEDIQYLCLSPPSCCMDRRLGGMLLAA